MSSNRDFSKSSNVAHMLSMENKGGLLSKKKSTSEKDKKEYNEAQTLLIKCQYIPVKNPLRFAASHLRVLTTLLTDSIKVRQQNSGYCPFLVDSALDNIRQIQRYWRCEVSLTCIGRFKASIFVYLSQSLRCTHGDGSPFTTLNVWMMEGNHCSSEFILHSKEINLLLPMSEKNETMVAVGVIYLDQLNRAMFHQIDSNGKIEAPFVLSVVGTRSLKSYEDQE
eukprot:scaffold421183_cov56-Attheya_sp.AAC.6